MLLRRNIFIPGLLNLCRTKTPKSAAGGLFLLTFLITFIPALCQDNFISDIRTDCARYSPGDTVHFTIAFQSAPQGDSLHILYRHLDRRIGERGIAGVSTPEIHWDWLPPGNDYRGYLAEVALIKNNSVFDRATIAVDVSSGWQKFPRYGFLSQYSYLNSIQIDQILDRLNRYHINGLQFYDWHHKHHKPLKGTPDNPASTWNDIANRTNYFATVQGYILGAHKRHMKAMAYNLLYGAWDNALQDGVLPEWRLFHDSAHQQPDFHDLPASWASDIYLMDPTNQKWMDYIFSTTRDALTALPFDGWHIDQLGDRGTLYNYQGQAVNLANSFLPFIQQAKDSLGVDLVMNAVNQFGQGGISLAPVDFLYSEVWAPNTQFADLASVVAYNNFLGRNSLNSVLAAYINHDLSGSPGQFNSPAVLLADAVIFAAGGAHLELGEHMLGSEYFPNSNLSMSQDLQTALIRYYDFLVAYQNLLRDGALSSISTLQTAGPYMLSASPRQGRIWAIARKSGRYTLYHLINFSDAATMEWADNSGIQTEPDTIFSLPLSFRSNENIAKLWTASPDFDDCSPREIGFSAKSDTVSFVLPRLKYWTMIVAETDSALNIKPDPQRNTPGNFRLTGNFPNPFNPSTRIEFFAPHRARLRIDIYNTLGQRIVTLADRPFGPGGHSVKWQPADNLASGIYICRLYIENQITESKKLLFMK